MAILYRPDASPEVVVPKSGKKFSFREIGELIRGKLIYSCVTYDSKILWIVAAGPGDDFDDERPNSTATFIALLSDIVQKMNAQNIVLNRILGSALLCEQKEVRAPRKKD